MQLIFKRLSIVCAGSFLLACAEISHKPDAALLAAPFANADLAYLAGRGAHLARRLDQASQAYLAALGTEPLHLNARNGLATLRAEQGNFGEAIALWTDMTGAAPVGPQSAFLFSNLGYAYFLNGQYEPALVALEQACVLDPLDHNAWYHLGQVLDRLGQTDRAQAMFRQASTLKRYDFKRDYAIAPKAGVPAIDSAVMAEKQEGVQWDTVELRQNSSGVYVLQRVAEAASTSPVEAPLVVTVTQPEPATIPMATLEISNGNGVTGMARQLAGLMNSKHLRVVRLTNQKSFGIARTRVEYEPTFRTAAESLAGRLHAASVMPVTDVGRADMRLVIGRDLSDAKTALLTGQKKGPPEQG